jgi:hypothetical protein
MMRSKQSHTKGIQQYLRDFWNTNHLSAVRQQQLIEDLVTTYRAAASQDQPGSTSTGLDFWVAKTYPAIKQQYGLTCNKWNKKASTSPENYVSPFDGKIK